MNAPPGTDFHDEQDERPIQAMSETDDIEQTKIEADGSTIRPPVRDEDNEQMPPIPESISRRAADQSASLIQALVEIAKNEQIGKKKRLKAIKDLGRHGTAAESALPALQELMGSDDEDILAASGQAIKDICRPIDPGSETDDAVDFAVESSRSLVLLPILSDENVNSRRHVVPLLEEIFEEDAAAAGGLSWALLFDKDKQVHKLAGQALSRKWGKQNLLAKARDFILFLIRKLGEQRREKLLLPPEETIKQLVTDLIPTLPRAVEERAEAIISFERIVGLTLRASLRSEAIPLIKSLLKEIPEDYEGKRTRGTLINTLLTALDLGIIAFDRHGKSHICSIQPVRGHQSDLKGYLRLIERTASGSSRKSFPIPPLDQLGIEETSLQESTVKQETTLHPSRP